MCAHYRLSMKQGLLWKGSPLYSTCVEGFKQYLPRILPWSKSLPWTQCFTMTTVSTATLRGNFSVMSQVRCSFRTATDIEDLWRPPPPHIHTILPGDLDHRLSQLKELVAHYPLEHFERITYLEALSRLELSFDFIYKASIPVECGMAFTWPIMLPREFVGFLQDYKPLSLVFLSYYCIILNRLENFWFLRGWDKSLLSEIWNCLPFDLRLWIDWPKAVCGVEA